MEMQKWMLWTLVGLCGLLSGVGCGATPAESPPQSGTGASTATTVGCPTGVADVEAQHVLMILWDHGGSGATQAGNRLTPLQADMGQLVHQLEPATHLYGYAIAPQSSRATDMFLQDILPAAPDAFACQVKNPYDLHQKRRCQEERRVYDAQRACLTAARQRIVTLMQSLTPARATSPDIGGAVAEAAATLAAYPLHIDRRLILYTALVDTVDVQLPQGVSGLQGATVIVRLVSTGTPPATVPWLATLTRQLTAWGAHVRAVPLAAPWSVVLRHGDLPNPVMVAQETPHVPVSQPPVLPPLVTPPASELATFMQTLTPGSYGVIVASHATEQAAQAEVRQLRSQYPALRPWHRQLVGKTNVWAVYIGDAYAYDSAIALKDKAIALGLRSDTFVWGSQRYAGVQ